jgi:mannose-6-phosphate isomerase-like protein (cupin superfamily)
MLSYKLINSSSNEIIHSTKNDLYQYKVYVGQHFISTQTINSYWYLDNDSVVSKSGNGVELDSKLLCVEIFGYTPETRSSSYDRYTDLPYINGCSTKQLINSVRLGDPTWQMLHMPPYTSEQQHHIHSTSRIVYVHKGRGTSHIGISDNNMKDIPLLEGDVLILDKMIPHHFSTDREELIVLPLHIFTSTGNEFNHPMYNGTHKI